MNKLIVGYGRISQRGTSDGISIGRQEELIKQYVCFKQLQGEFRFLHDESVSGFSDRRKSFQQLLELVKAGQVSHVIVFDLSRLARNVRLTLEAVDLMNSKEVVFSSLSESISTDSAVGKFFLVICSAFNQMLRDQVSEKMATMHEFNKKNLIAGPGFVPYGFRKEGRRLIHDEFQQSIIRKIAELRSKNLSFDRIAEELNSEGAPAKNGGIWRAGSVHAIYKKQSA